jgi:hypothetical protein
VTEAPANKRENRQHPQHDLGRGQRRPVAVPGSGQQRRAGPALRRDDQVRDRVADRRAGNSGASKR